MKAKLLGFKYLDFETDKGDKIKGTKLYVMYPDTTVTGMLVGEVYAADDTGILAVNPKDFLNKDIIIDTNLKGRTTAIYSA